MKKIQLIFISAAFVLLLAACSDSSEQGSVSSEVVELNISAEAESSDMEVMSDDSNDINSGQTMSDNNTDGNAATGTSQNEGVAAATGVVSGNASQSATGVESSVADMSGDALAFPSVVPVEVSADTSADEFANYSGASSQSQGASSSHTGNGSQDTQPQESSDSSYFVPDVPHEMTVTDDGTVLLPFVSY